MMQRTEEAGSCAPGAIDAHAQTRDERRGGRVEVGLPRVAENANRQRMTEIGLYLPPPAKSCLPTDAGED